MAQTATVQIQMPEMGESVTEGIVLEWHVAEGDFVEEGDTVVEVSTDKVDAEVPAPAAGTITKLGAAVDDAGPGGGVVEEGDPVVEVSTDRVDAEVPAPAAGTITKLVAAVDDEVPVGAVLAEMEPGTNGASAGTAEESGASSPGPRALGDAAPPPR